MTDEKKKDFTRRLSQCNGGEMIVIEYDIFYAYLEDAENAFELGGPDFKDAIRHCDQVLVRLQNSLNFDYELAGQLFPLYEYARRQLALALATHKRKPMSFAKNVVDKLYTAFVEVAKQDKSEPIMGNTQKVVAGMTYGKTSISEGYENYDRQRGFLA